MYLQLEILSIISNILNNNDINENVLDHELKDIGIDSISFIKIVIAIEEKCHMDFDDEMLIVTKFPTIKTVIEYVETKIK